MPKFIISQYVEAPNAQVAAQVGQRLQQGTETVAVPVTIGAQVVEPAWMEVDTTVVDRVIKRVIAGVIIFYISRGLKRWAKQ